MKPSFKNKIKKNVFRVTFAGIKPLASMSKLIYTLGMELKFLRDWRSYPNPEWYDHELDLVMFPIQRKPHFFERGVYASELIKNKKVLDLCCGDGSVSALFLAPLANSVTGVDFDSSAISHAKRRWSSISNCEFQKMDIRNLEFDKNSFDVCTWDAAIEHFTTSEMENILVSIKQLLKPEGILHGSTVKKTEVKGHHEHEFEFETINELAQFLTKNFKYCQTWERNHADRTNFYFRCSDYKLNERTFN